MKSNKTYALDTGAITNNAGVKSLLVFFFVVLGFVFVRQLHSINDTGLHSESEEIYFIDIPKESYTLDHTLKCPALSDVQREIRHRKEKIWEEWNVTHYPNFLKLMDIPATSWRLQKLKLIQLLLDSLNQTRTEPSSFVIAFSGSSVTAGHDNFLSEAYPSVVTENLSPVFKSLNISLVVRNQAIGNNPCYAYDACVATHLGDDVDVVSWEQSMNCGWDSRPLDTFTRQSQFLKKKPTVMYFLSGGPLWTFNSCNAENITEDLRYSRPPLTSEEKKILSQSLSKTVDENSLMATFEFLKDQKESKDFIPRRFMTSAPMGQSIFPIQPYHCRGPYPANFTDKTLGKGVAWHPGRLGHKLRGDNYAYTFLTILSEAIADVQSFVCDINLHDSLTVPRNHTRRRLKKESPPVQQSPELPQRFSSKQIEESVHRLKLLLNLEFSNDRYKQLISYLTKRIFITSNYQLIQYFLQKYLSDMYESVNISPVPYYYKLPETNSPANCFTDYEPRTKNSLDSIIIHSLHSIPNIDENLINTSLPWRKEFSFLDRTAVSKQEKRGLFYIDRKYIYISSNKSSTIYFNITSSLIQDNPLWICELQKGFARYPSTMMDLDQGALLTVWVHGRNDTSTNIELELKLLTDQCYRSIQVIPKGNHILSVEQKTDKQVNIAYLVTW